MILKKSNVHYFRLDEMWLAVSGFFYVKKYGLVTKLATAKI